MTKSKLLSKAPILEALAQINYQTSDGVTPDLEAWARSLSPSSVEEIYQVQIPAIDEPIRSLYGRRFRLESGKVIIQVTNDFLAISQSGGYQDWDSFIAKIQGYLASFLSAMRISNISRTALRYINEFDFDASEPPGAYLTQISPHAVGPDFDSRITSVSTNYSIPKIFGEAQIQQTLELRSAVSKWNVNLDIDVFTNRAVKADMSDVMVELQLLRKYKNRVFESLITESCLGRFE